MIIKNDRFPHSPECLEKSQFPDRRLWRWARIWPVLSFRLGHDLTHSISIFSRVLKGGTFFSRIWSDLNKSLHYSYFHEFLKYGNDSWCKLKLRCCSKRCKSFLPPSTSFLPPFLLWILVICMLKFDFQWVFYVKKGGKKLVRGVKNFCISKYEYSAFFCTKNYYHILKTREKRCKWNSTILGYEWKCNAYFENLSFHFFLSLK